MQSFRLSESLCNRVVQRYALSQSLEHAEVEVAWEFCGLPALLPDPVRTTKLPNTVGDSAKDALLWLLQFLLLTGEY